MTEDEKHLVEQVESLANSRANAAFLIGKLMGGLMNLRALARGLDTDDDPPGPICIAIDGMVADAYPIIEREFYPKTEAKEPPDLLK